MAAHMVTKHSVSIPRDDRSQPKLCFDLIPLS
jgi:hypothetical protein